jgi:hypothetical protein
VAKARPLVALGLDTAATFRAVLGKPGVEELQDLYVQAVQPDHRLVGRVAMVVPGPAGRDDEIAGCMVVRSPSTAV